MRRAFEDAYEYGERFTRWVITELRADGWNVLRLDQLPPGDWQGPTLNGSDDPTLPDLQITKEGVTFAVEVKRKAEPTFTDITQTWDFGVEHWDDYTRYSHVQGIPVFIVIGCDKDYTVHAARTTHLRPRLGSAGNGTPSMAYIPVDQFNTDWMLHLNRCRTALNNQRKRNQL